MREIEKADYGALCKDYSDSVDALQRAIAVPKKQAYDREQVASLAQVSSLATLSLMPEAAKRIIETFVQQEPAVSLSVLAPEAHGYEVQSHGAIKMLGGLFDQFNYERAVSDNVEMTSKHAVAIVAFDLGAG